MMTVPLGNKLRLSDRITDPETGLADDPQGLALTVVGPDGSIEPVDLLHPEKGLWIGFYHPQVAGVHRVRFEEPTPGSGVATSAGETVFLVTA